MQARAELSAAGEISIQNYYDDANVPAASQVNFVEALIATLQNYLSPYTLSKSNNVNMPPRPILPNGPGNFFRAGVNGKVVNVHDNVAWVAIHSVFLPTNNPTAEETEGVGGVDE